MPLDYVPMSSFTVDHTMSISKDPAQIKFHSISPIQVDYDETPVSGFHSCSGSEGHKTWDPGTARFPNVTFTAHCSAAGSKAIYQMFQDTAQGKLDRPDITVNIINPKDKKKPIITVTMFEVGLVSYSPGVSGSADNPGVLSVSFTIAPNRMALKTY